MAERRRIRKLADELGATITEYLEKFNALSPEKFKKWKEGKLLRMREAASLRNAYGKKNHAKIVKKIITGAFEVQFSVYRCKNLKKADTFGKSDPVVLLKFNGEEVGRTPVVPKTLNPEWGRFKFNSSLVMGKVNDAGHKDPDGGQFTLEVYDMDMKVKLGDFLGYTVVDSILACELDPETRINKEARDLVNKPGQKLKTVGGQITFSCKAKWLKGGTPGSKLSFKCSGSNGEDLDPGTGAKGGLVDNINLPNINLGIKMPEGESIRVAK